MPFSRRLSVSTSEIEDLAVTNGKIANTTITNAKINASAAIVRSKLAQEALVSYPLNIMEARNENGTIMDSTGGAGLFSINSGGWGSGAISIVGETATGNKKTDTLKKEFAIPPEYDAAQDMRIVVTGLRAVGGGGLSTATVDLLVYKLSNIGGTAADICDTAAQTFDGTATDYVFNMVETNLVAGDKLSILLKIVLEEDGTNPTYAQFGGVTVQLDIQG